MRLSGTVRAALARVSRSETPVLGRRSGDGFVAAPLVKAPPVSKVKQLDAIEARPATVDGKAFVKAALADLGVRVARGEKVRVAFDIDDTLADTRVRTLTIAKAWDAANGTHHFDRLTLAQVAHNGFDTAMAMGLPGPVETAFAEHWEKAFWDGANFVHDAPMAGIVELVKQAKAAGADVVFLTGRNQDLESATIAQLKRFGLDATEANVVSKPPHVRTVPFKASWLEQSAAEGNHLSFFFTESRRDIAGVQGALPNCSTVLLDSAFGGTEPVRGDTPVYPRAW